VAGEGVGVETISPHQLTGRGSRSIVEVGDLVADQLVEVVLRLTFPYGELGRETGAIVAMTDRHGVSEEPVARLSWTYADDRTNDGQPRDHEVDRAVARQFVARARQEAVQHNRRGDFERARRVLEGTARRIRTYAGNDAELRDLVGTMEGETLRFTHRMSERSLKGIHFQSANVARSRDEMGRSRKRTR
jgi:hypothetical protein